VGKEGESGWQIHVPSLLLSCTRTSPYSLFTREPFATFQTPASVCCNGVQPLVLPPPHRERSQEAKAGEWVAVAGVQREDAVWVLVALKPNRIIHKRTDANYSSFHIRVFLGLSNPQGQSQTSTLSIPRDNFGERKAKFNLGISRATQM
jgi:hypothetical protein